MAPGDTKVENLGHIDILFEWATVRIETEVKGWEETTDASLSTKGDHIGAASISVL